VLNQDEVVQSSDAKSFVASMAVMNRTAEAVPLRRLHLDVHVSATICGKLHIVTSTNSSGSVVSLNNVARLYGRFAALRNVTAEFEAGKLYLILGENGAGKSTLLRVIAGLIQPTRGKVRVLGSSKIRDVAGQFGYMAHAPMLYEELSGMENLLYFAKLYGIVNETKCEQAIRTVGLDPTLKRRVGQYSQGMRQRMSLARSILNDPKLLLLDEPFSNVDVHSAQEMARLLGQMRDAGRTIFLVTHQPGLLQGIADEAVMMSSGEIVSRDVMRSAVSR
jgi:ABC-type multidrug transport system ATPase subunit